MAGSLVPEIKGNLGVIQEFDYDTMELLSEFYVKPGFFRAHEFCPDMVSLSKALVKISDYVVGELKRPVRMEEEEAERLNFENALPVRDSVIDYEMQEDLLYIHETDHAIKKVYLRGKESVWQVEFADTYQTMKTFEEAEYSIAMWLDALPADSYDLFLMYGEE